MRSTLIVVTVLVILTGCGKRGQPPARAAQEPAADKPAAQEPANPPPVQQPAKPPPVQAGKPFSPVAFGGIIDRGEKPDREIRQELAGVWRVTLTVYKFVGDDAACYFTEFGGREEAETTGYATVRLPDGAKVGDVWTVDAEFDHQRPFRYERWGLVQVRAWRFGKAASAEQAKRPAEPPPAPTFDPVAIAAKINAGDRSLDTLRKELRGPWRAALVVVGFKNEFAVCVFATKPKSGDRVLINLPDTARAEQVWTVEFTFDPDDSAPEEKLWGVRLKRTIATQTIDEYAVSLRKK